MQESLFTNISRDERQEQGRVKWIKNKCRGTLEFPTGVGKTRTALKCLSSVLDKYPELRILVVVPTDNLKSQWIPQLDTWGLGYNSEVQIINTVVKRNWQADILVLDECHRYNSDTFKEIFHKVRYRYILGLTATFERLDDKHAIMEKYCPVIDKITTEEALANGWISEFKEYQVLIDVDDIDVYKQYNREFTEHYEFFGFDFNLAMSCIGPKGFINRAKLRDMMCPTGTEEQRKQVFKNITYHATAFMRTIQKRKAFINNHPKKLELARKIINARPTAKIITFSNNVAMAEAIGLGMVYTGKDSKKKGRITLEEFNEMPFGVINSCAKLNEGADIKGLSVAIVLGRDSSETKSVQRRGRVVRKEGDKIAEIFNLVIDQTVETKWFSNSHQTTEYVTIDEKGLDNVLDGKEPEPYVKKIKDFTFRY
jgi:superfamily II DNA or RNA helicase